jgi:hypothetical protein
LIYGACIPVSDLVASATDELRTELAESDSSWAPKTVDEIEEDPCSLGEAVPLNFYRPFHSSIYLGLSWDSVGDNETGAEFKARVEQEIGRLFGSQECTTHSESWYC